MSYASLGWMTWMIIGVVCRVIEAALIVWMFWAVCMMADELGRLRAEIDRKERGDP